MIDGLRDVDDNGEVTWAPRSPEELAALQTLVESAVGFDEARGDVVNIQSLELSAQIEGGSVAENGLLRSLSVNAMSIAQIVVLGIVAIMLGLFVIRPIMKSAGTPPILPNPPQLNDAVGVLSAEEGITAPGQALDRESAPVGLIEGVAAERPDRRDQLESAVSEHTERAARVISGWLDGPDTEQAN